MAVFDITNYCNTSCTYCNRKNISGTGNLRQEPSIDTIIDIHEQLKALGVEHLALQGGEPLLRKDIVSVIQQIRKLRGKPYLDLKSRWDALISKQLTHNRLQVMCYQILKDIGFPIMSITTNGTYYSKDIEQALFNANFHLEVSLDACEEQLNCQFRKGGSFDLITDTITKYARMLPVIMNTTVYKENVSQIDKLISFAHKLGCIHIVLNPLRTAGTYADWTDDYLTQINKILDTAEQRNLTILVEFILPMNRVAGTNALDELKHKLRKASNVMIQFYKCQAYKNMESIYIGSDLEVYGCPWIAGFKKYSIGNVGKQPISELWELKCIGKFCNTNHEDNKLDCTAADNCRGNLL